MTLKSLALISSLLLLGACNRQPWVAYVEPASGTDTARLRVITNGEVRGGSYVGCVGNEQGLAKAGRFYDGDKPSINYPQSPLVPPRLGMAPRVLPKMAEYLGMTRMAEGVYAEIVAEYRVPAGKPFLLVREELGGGAATAAPTANARRCRGCTPLKRAGNTRPMSAWSMAVMSRARWACVVRSLSTSCRRRTKPFPRRWSRHRRRIVLVVERRVNLVNVH